MIQEADLNGDGKVDYRGKYHKRHPKWWPIYCVCLFDLILYDPSTIFLLNGDGSSWVEPVLS